MPPGATDIRESGSSSRVSGSIAAWLILCLTLLAPVLGGSTQLWAEAALAVLTGALFVIVPPRRRLGRTPTLLFAGVAILPLVSFLPSRWFGLPPDWRTALGRMGIELPATLSAQPWVTFEACCLLWLGAAWAYYLLAFDWPATAREKMWDGYCLGIVGLAGLLSASYAAKVHVPFWPGVREFGFFPNRNQTANVLALGGIIMYANAFQHLQRGRRSGWFWLLGVALVCWALILNYSRAGIILFFAGALVWHLWWSIQARGATRPALTFGPIAVLLALFAVVGGETFLRFRTQGLDVMAPQGGRLLIQRDALELLQQSPLWGLGLGNFRAIFSVVRRFYVAPNEAIHPESDWLWLSTEAGVIAAVLLLALFIWWLRHCFPFDAGSWRRMRVGATIAGCAFAIHGFIDVSGHRVGAMWPALFVASTALHPGIVRRDSRFHAFVFRLLGIALIAIGGWWFASIAGMRVPFPTTATLSRSFTEIDRAVARDDYNAMLQNSSEALKITPLNWELYYKRGFAEAALLRPRSEILRDFAAARYLLPNWRDLYIKEGRVWLLIGEPNLAFDVWRDGMMHVGKEVRPFYGELYGLVKDDPNLRDRWRMLGEGRKECVLVFLQNATPTEFQIELNRLLAEDRPLRDWSAAEFKTLFNFWYQRGEKLALAETLRAHPEWQEIGWRELARVYADYQDYRQAYETVKRFADPPAINLSPNEPAESLADRFRVTNSDRDGVLLAMAEASQGKIDDGLAALALLSSRPNPSAAVFYVQGELLSRKGDWPKAWQAIWKYVEQDRS